MEAKLGFLAKWDVYGSITNTPDNVMPIGYK